MFLFLGTRELNRNETLLSGSQCTYCNQATTLIETRYDTFFHLFWIPLFKVGSHGYTQCTHCKRLEFNE
ncbi:MAG: zinc-ribbon domain-containing protein [Flavobacteriaceae bacterium]